MVPSSESSTTPLAEQTHWEIWIADYEGTPLWRGALYGAYRDPLPFTFYSLPQLADFINVWDAPYPVRVDLVQGEHLAHTVAEQLQARRLVCFSFSYRLYTGA